MKNNELNRRSFLTKAGVLAGAAVVAPSAVFSAPKVELENKSNLILNSGQ